MSDADNDNEASNTGCNDAGSHLPQTEKVPHMTAMINVTMEMPAKKPQTNLHSHAMAEGSRQSALVTMIPSQVSSTRADSMSSRHVHYINGHLPPLLQENRKWTKQGLPALLTWAGSLGDPWVIPDQDLMQALQMIIMTINLNFSDLTAICPGAPVFILATWQLSVWHSNFSSTALATMAHFLASDADHEEPSDIQEMCNKLLDGLAFLYQDLDASKPEYAY
ncbi:hypothetical protein EDC04DRAFT_2907399 [Pisolithus marmoratus]|nr:hypothetical protein EDC04DRAFT_2907399 [Pisolithus marmoratus]